GRPWFQDDVPGPAERNGRVSARPFLGLNGDGPGPGLAIDFSGVLAGVRGVREGDRFEPRASTVGSRGHDVKAGGWSSRVGVDQTDVELPGTGARSGLYGKVGGEELNAVAGVGRGRRGRRQQPAGK